MSAHHTSVALALMIWLVVASGCQSMPPDPENTTVVPAQNSCATTTISESARQLGLPIPNEIVLAVSRCELSAEDETFWRQRIARTELRDWRALSSGKRDFAFYRPNDDQRQASSIKSFSLFNVYSYLEVEEAPCSNDEYLEIIASTNHEPIKVSDLTKDQNQIWSNRVAELNLEKRLIRPYAVKGLLDVQAIKLSDQEYVSINVSPFLDNLFRYFVFRDTYCGKVVSASPIDVLPI